ncbi:hypothetical protein AB0399_40280 [Streptomyces sp. NPDC088194]|uniref:hypothetical protein n=1 Tax=Streptomyces sp. NPDC088194 TaxID=3154931 RepID=UPI00344F1B1E
MKRRVGSPQVPAGPQYAFFELMQRHVLNQGDKSLALLSKESGWSRQTWHKALRGPQLPNRDLVRALVEHLFPEQDDADRRRRMVEETLRAWTEAVAERTFGPSKGQPVPVPRVADPRLLRTTDQPEGPVQRPARPTNSLEYAMSQFRGSAAKRRANLPEEERFFNLFRSYYTQAGSPPMRWVEARMPEESAVTRSTLNEWLNGRSLPSYTEKLEQVMKVMRQRVPVSEQELATDVAERAEIQRALTDAWRARPH